MRPSRAARADRCWCGATGIGKTALLEYLVVSASDLERLDGLPRPQRQALEIVFGLSDGAPPGWALSELVEAAARSGQPDAAADALRQLAEMAHACGTDWILGVEARARALPADSADAEELYRRAIEHLERLGAELARAHLLRAVHLDRDGGVRQAHPQGAAGDGREGAQAPGETRDELTPQEWQIAQMARQGLSNPEIGARLFLSPRTIESRLSHVYGKLGIRSRQELGNALPSSDAGSVGA